MPVWKLLTLTATFAVALGGSACRGRDAQLHQAAQSVESIRATTSTVAMAWLAGELSDRFAQDAVARAFQLAEQTRTELSSSPESMADTRASAIVEDCQHLSRLLSHLSDSIQRHDRAAAQDALVDVSAPFASFQ